MYSMISLSIENGLGLVDAIDAGISDVKNSVLREAYGFVKRRIEAGDNLSEAMSRGLCSSLFYEHEIETIRVNEDVGDLSFAIDRLTNLLGNSGYSLT